MFFPVTFSDRNFDRISFLFLERESSFENSARGFKIAAMQRPKKD
jgi:hypothetical protein